MQIHKVDFSFSPVASNLLLLAVANNLVLKVSFKPLKMLLSRITV